ncbi:co-chaperone GroES [Vibrio parahaemolyticus]|uniref:co-chaperone GroES n=1 Tax=Vibrio parahaemolyticus TaxID=670 RepID=UPI0008132EB9|nr:co-chaperone GroES [Vibrio parahaemolyticus]EGQ8310262.1 co-chaperone GroES [Vibrio parahaemolyticus]EGQ8850014.1 co-chaperone GroES [Vibrio parahaemolyticus]EGQ8854205.1 co-chaperone GroES [Vibrio parahaemolyticus]EGQ8873451.1 co-chaperone GroES [Vibrio parahaemolyticus]EGQ8993165.1 co-chaperone GroES [Vibrio parahaemolyticus]
MKIRPLNDKLIVERQEVENKSEGGIVLTSQSVKKSNRGKVIAVGLGKRLENGERAAMEVKEGDQIIFNDGYGVKTEKIDGAEYLILSESDVLAIVE